MARIVIEVNSTTVIAVGSAMLGAGLGLWAQFGRGDSVQSPVTTRHKSVPAATAPAPPVSSTVAAPPGWHLTFADEFDGDRLDSGKWIDSYPHDVRTHANNEQQFYSSDSVTVAGGFLHLTARHRTQGGMPYTSGMVASFGKLAQKYGKFEMRAKFPAGRGLWPAFWLLPATGGWPPEVDILEILGHQPSRVYFSNHWGTRDAHQHNTGPFDGPDFSKDFHTFTLEWSPNVLIWSVDGVERYRRSDHIPQEPMYVLANLAVGGDWPGFPDATTPFPAEMVIDYIRVYNKQ